MFGDPGPRPREPQRSQDAKTATTWGLAATAHRAPRPSLPPPNPGQIRVGSAASSIRALGAKRPTNTPIFATPLPPQRAQRRPRREEPRTKRAPLGLAPRARMVGG